MTKMTPAVKATVRHFVEHVRDAGNISPDAREIEIAIAVERLREEHGISVDPDKFDRMVAR